MNGELVGWRVRPRFRIPEGKLPFKFSLSTEFGFPSTGKLQWSFEYYGSTGEVTNPLPFTQQVHQFFPGFDYDFNANVVLNVGVGLGATDAGNTAVFKTRLGWIFR